MKLEKYYEWLVKVKKDGYQLQNAPFELRNDHKIVMAAVQKNGGALQFVSKQLLLQEDSSSTSIFLEAVRQDGEALRYVPENIKTTTTNQNYKEIAMTAVTQNGRALRFVPHDIQQQYKDIVLAAVSSTPDAIRFISNEEMKRDSDVLIAAGMFDNNNGTNIHNNNLDDDNKNSNKNLDDDNKEQEDNGYRHDAVDDIHHQQQQQQPNNNNNDMIKITLSTRFALNVDSSSDATNFTALFKQHPYIQKGKFKVYAPNAFDKQTCDPNWTDFDHPCRGTRDTCQLLLSLRNGSSSSDNNNNDNDVPLHHRPNNDCCWRYSFRCQLIDSKRTEGLMIQLIEKEDWLSTDIPVLGNGQRIERDMAQSMRLKIFHVYRPIRHGGYESKFQYHHIDQVISKIKTWYDDDCQDMSECSIYPEGDE